MNEFTIIYTCTYVVCIYIYTSNHSRRYHVPQPCLFFGHIFLLSSKDSKVHTITHVPRSRASNCKWQEITESESEPDAALSISEFLRIDKHPGEQKRYLLWRWHRYTQYLVYTATLGVRLLTSAPPLWTTIKYMCMCVYKSFCDITFETSSYSIHLVSIYWLSVALQGLLVWNWRGKKS